MSKKIIIPIVIWGDSYINNFVKYTYKNLIYEINEYSSFYKKFNIQIIICTQLKSFNIFKTLFKNLIINLKLININKLINSKIKNLDKYQLLKTIQQGIFYKFRSNNIFLLLYPDFIWKIGSLKFVIEKILNKKLVLAYCPQSIEESYEEIKFDAKFLRRDFEEFIIKNLHPIVKSNEYNEKNFNFTTGASIINITFNGYVFRSFHLHPIALNSGKFCENDFLSPINVSLDEDFVSNLNLNKKDYYIPKRSSDMIFSSLLGLNELLLPKNIHQNNFENYYYWAEMYAQKIHIEFSKNIFFLGKKSSQDEKIIQKLDKLLEKIYKNLKTSNISNINSEQIIYFLCRHLKINKYSLDLNFFLNKLHYVYKKNINNANFYPYKTLNKFTKDEKAISKYLINNFYS